MDHILWCYALFSKTKIHCPIVNLHPIIVSSLAVSLLYDHEFVHFYLKVFYFLEP